MHFGLFGGARTKHGPLEASERFDEAIEVIRKAWISGGRFSHHGKRWNFEDVVVEPEPRQLPHPPLWMVADSPDSIRRATRDGFNLLLDRLALVEQVIERVGIFREERARYGRKANVASLRAFAVEVMPAVEAAMPVRVAAE